VRSDADDGLFQKPSRQRSRITEGITSKDSLDSRSEIRCF
jgi:hypothetical protein